MIVHQKTWGGVFNYIVGNDSRFEYRRNNANIGGDNLIKHWQLLVNLCETEYFIMASDDDVYHPDYLKSISELTEKYPMVNIFRPRINIIDSDDNISFQEGKYNELIDQLHFFRYYYQTDFVYCEAAYCYRTKPFKEAGGFVEFPLAWFSDNATNMMMAKNGIAITKDVLFSFRVSSESVSSKGDTKSAAKKLEATIMYYEWVTNYIKNMDDDTEEIGLLGRAMFDCQREIILNINNYLPNCNLRDFWYYHKYVQKHFAMSRLVMFYYWFNYHRHHGFAI